MVNVPSLLRRRTAQDSNGDGVVDARDGQPVVTDRDADRATYRSGSLATDDERDADAARRTTERDTDAGGVGGRPTGERTVDAGPDADAERRAAERGALARAATARSAVDGTRSAAAARPSTVDDEPRTPTDPIRVADAGPVRTAPHPVDADRPTDRDRTTPVDPTTPTAGVATRPANRDRVAADEARPEPPVVRRSEAAGQPARHPRPDRLGGGRGVRAHRHPGRVRHRARRARRGASRCWA